VKLCLQRSSAGLTARLIVAQSVEGDANERSNSAAQLSDSANPPIARSMCIATAGAWD